MYKHDTWQLHTFYTSGVLIHRPDTVAVDSHTGLHDNKDQSHTVYKPFTVLKVKDNTCKGFFAW